MALATLLEDPSSNLSILRLAENQIVTEGMITLANSLVNNAKLKELCLSQNPFDGSVHNHIDYQSVNDVFCRLLCNKSSISNIYSSNHILQKLYCIGSRHELDTYLRMNKCANKSRVAIKKILRYHPNIDMTPLFEWDEDGEQSLKAFPYVIHCFDIARQGLELNQRGYKIEEKKLSAIYQFAKAMPLLFVPASHIKFDGKKRKRDAILYKEK